MSTASEILQLLSNDNGWLVRQVEAENIIRDMTLDGEIYALNIDINLRQHEAYALSLRLLERVRAVYPKANLPVYHTALSAAGLRDHEQAIEMAREAVAREPLNIELRSLLVRACAAADRHGEARDALKATLPTSTQEAGYLTELSQFVDFCEAYPLHKAKAALVRLRESGSYCGPDGAREIILSAIRDARPFSMVRLGDGEGAWLSFDAYDEGRFNALYRANRTSFTEDWFGSRRLVDDYAFRMFSRRLQDEFKTHDLIGIPPLERLEQEEGFLSTRGIPSSVNAFRMLGLFDQVPGPLRFCSNSINLALAAHTDFYQEVFSAVKRIGIITSQHELAPKLAAAGMDIVSNHVVPGDSRNFHRDADGHPACQYPGHVERISSELAASDFKGVVYLVAAGFVGKRYLKIIRERGGIALDLGSLADHWIRHGLPR